MPWFRLTVRDILNKEYSSEQSFDSDDRALEEYGELKKKAERDMSEHRLFLMPTKIVRIVVREEVRDITPVPAGVSLSDDLDG